MSDELMNSLDVPRTSGSQIMVVGVGGAGGNAVNHMWELGIEGVDFMVCNTDQQALDQSPIEVKVRLGEEGLGAGSDPANGRRAAIESLDAVRARFEAAGTRMVFITAGMGGGTGTGASPVLAKLTHEMGILTVGIVTSPLVLEGKMRFDQAMKGIEEMREHVDALVVINNENILKIYGRLSLKQAFGKADDILAAAAKGIAEIITVKSDLVNVDFADVCRVMRNSGRAHLGVATAEGEERAEIAARMTLESPLLDHNLIRGAKKILLNISCRASDELRYEEVVKALTYIQSEASVVDDRGLVQSANIIWGTSEKPYLGDALELVVVATGFDPEQAVQPDKTLSTEPVDLPTVPPELPALESIKPPRHPETTIRPPRQVILGERSNRFADLKEKLSMPAYVRRRVPLITADGAVRERLVVRDRSAGRDGGSGSLFDQTSDD